MSTFMGEIIIPSNNTQKYSELTLTKGTWVLYAKDKTNLIVKTGKDAEAFQSGTQIGFTIDKQTTFYIQAGAPAGVETTAFYTNSVFNNASAVSALPVASSGGGSGGTTYTFNAPLISDDSDEVSLNLDSASGLNVSDNNLSIDLSKNSAFTGTKNGNVAISSGVASVVGFSDLATKTYVDSKVSFVVLSTISDATTANIPAGSFGVVIG